MHRFQITIIYKLHSTSCANTYITEYKYVFIKARCLCAAVPTAAVDGLLIHQQPDCDFGRFRQQLRRVGHEAAMPSGTQGAPGWLCVTEKFRPWTRAGTMPSPWKEIKTGPSRKTLLSPGREHGVPSLFFFSASLTPIRSAIPGGHPVRYWYRLRPDYWHSVSGASTGVTVTLVVTSFEPPLASVMIALTV